MRIYQHLVDNNTLMDEQYGFGMNSSIVKATHKSPNAILNAFNNKKLWYIL